MLFVVLIVLASCAPHEVRKVAKVGFHEPILVLAASPQHTPTEPRLATIHTDPYEGWEAWCEPEVYERGCETRADCADIEHPAGWPLKCVRPWWSKSDDLKVCAPGYDGSGQWRKWRRERLREIVRQQYFEETTHCDPDTRVVEQGWECQREAAQANKLADFLWLVYYRETTGRPWKRHKLSPDLHANQLSWSRDRMARRYGWKVETSKRGNVEGFTRIAHDANEHYTQEHRWRAGLGPYGMNAAGWTATWDPHAPPEILCREVESTEAYLRRARQVWRKLKGGVDCNRDGDVDYQREPTLGLIHRGASGGRICPRGGEVTLKDGFLRRMKRMGLNPDKPVLLSFFGTPIERERQNERAGEIYEVLEADLPAP